MSRQVIRRVVPRVGSAAFAVALAVAPAHAVTIRHDVADSSYTTLAADPRYEATGMVTNSNGGLCTGTLIHPEYVLTAAHCVPLNSSVTITFSLGPELGSETVTGTAVERVRDPGFDNNTLVAGNDVGIIRLGTPILDVTPAQLYRGASELGTTTTIIGYGRTGTGLTGDTLAAGTKRAATNVVDATGTAFTGGTTEVIAIDFDSPAGGPADNTFGSTAATGNEGGIITGDSGGGWYAQFNGVSYLIGVTSFAASVDNDTDGDYGDLGGAGRVGQHLAFIDANHDATVFSNGSSFNWDTDASWAGGDEPGSANAAVVNGGTVTVSSADEQAKYLFVQDGGSLAVTAGDLTAHTLIQKTGGAVSLTGGTLAVIDIVGSLANAGGTYAPGNSTALSTIDGTYTQSATSTLAIELAGATAGSGYDRVTVTGNVSLDGHLDLDTTYTPNLGDSFDILISSGGVVSGTFDTIAGVVLDAATGLAVTYAADRVAVTVATLGDANLDGDVSLADLSLLGSNWNQAGTWIQGDFNGDGMVSLADLSLLGSNWGFEALGAEEIEAIALSFSAVPEPGSLAVLVGGLGLLWRRR